MFIPFISKAQPSYQKLLESSPNEQYNLMFRFINDVWFYTKKGDVKNKKQQLHLLYQKAKQNNNNTIMMQAEYMRIMSFLRFKKNDSFETELLQLRKLAQKKSNVVLEAEINFRLGRYHWRDKSKEKGIFYLMEMEELLPLVPNTYTAKPKYISFYGIRYYFFGDYNAAIDVLKLIFKTKENNHNAKDFYNAVNTIGLCYQKMNKIDSSDYYFKWLINHSYNYGGEGWQYIALGNFAHNLYYYKNDVDTALPLLIKAYNNAKKRSDIIDVCSNSIYIADIYMEKKNFEKAKYFIDEAMNNFPSYRSLYYKKKLYPILIQWYIQDKQPSKAIAYVDSLHWVSGEYNQSYSSKYILGATIKSNIAKRKLKTSQLMIIHNKEMYRRNLIIFFVSSILVLFLIILFYMRRRMKYKLLQHKLDLKNAKTSMIRFRKRMNEKNLLIEKLEGFNKSQNLDDIINELKNSVILVNEDWVDFQETYSKAYPGFIAHLKKNYSEFTQTELRYILMICLEFNHNEMAKILGVSPDSMRVTSYRLRKKVGIKNTDEFNDFFVTLLEDWENQDTQMNLVI